MTDLPPVSQLLARLNEQDSTNLKACLTSATNTWLQSLALLGGKSYAKPADLERLLQMFALVESSAPSAQSATDYAPNRNGGTRQIYQTQMTTGNPSGDRFVEGLSRDLGVPLP